jgi:hypothetical protein
MIVHLSTLAAAVAGSAVLTAAALAVPASASTAPAGTAPTSTAADGATAPHGIPLDGGGRGPLIQHAGYQATVGGAGATSVSADWVQPASNDCAGLTPAVNRYLIVDVSLLEKNNPNPITESAGVQYQCWYQDGTQNVEYLVVGAGFADKGYYSDPLLPGDAMSASVALVGTHYVTTLTDATENWSESRDVATRGISHNDTVDVWVNDLGSSTEYGSITLTNVKIDGQPLAAADPVALNSTETDGVTDHTGPITGGNSFTVTRSS